MLYVVLSGFLLAAASPFLARRSGRASGRLLALLPASLALYFASLVPAIRDGALLIEYPWMPGLDITLNFLVDGLSLLFALIISGIGALILIYAGAYLKDHPHLNRFYVIVLCFMASMLGLVLSDNLITLFVFWELTSITSYLLIGFNHEDENARACALQSLFVTVAGGLALLAGLILLATMSGTHSLHAILNSGETMHAHGFYPAAVICLLLGAFTKSAQVPFHFWLPNAMTAPTPVSAYLHSATMVKAGVYLMARLNPSLGGDEWWTHSLMFFGALTMLIGAYFAFSDTGFKKVLAYSTVMALGALTLLIGVGTAAATTAFVCFLLAHSLYKGALFLIAGAVDHATGVKDIARMGGLGGRMPMTALCACLAALSLAGLPPLFGFIAKELLFEALLEAPRWSTLLTGVAVVAAMLTVAVAGLAAIKPFFGKQVPTPREPHDPPPGMLAAPVLLSVTALILGLAPFVFANTLLNAAVAAVYGGPVATGLALWHGVNTPLILSGASLGIGILLFAGWTRVQPVLSDVNAVLGRFGPEALYVKLLDAIARIAAWQTRILQNGVLGVYLLIIVLTTFGLAGYTLLTRCGLHLTLELDDSHFYEWGIAVLLVVAAVFASATRSRLGAVASMGVLGFGVALTFILFSAPDLGITQLLVETLTVILLVLVLFKLPAFGKLSSLAERCRDLAAAVFAGAVITLIVQAALNIRHFDSISSYYIENSASLAHGRNIVNVILVDFRALDTLGEIFVLAIAALGVFSMLRLKAEDGNRA